MSKQLGGVPKWAWLSFVVLGLISAIFYLGSVSLEVLK